MNLLNTPVIPASEDGWWTPPSSTRSALRPARVLVLAADTGDGGAAESRIGKMLAACKLASSDHLMLPLPAGQRLAWHQLRDAVSPELVILLGILPQALGIAARLAPNQLTGFDGRSWIISAVPDTFFADDALRGHIWNQCLKPFFRL